MKDLYIIIAPWILSAWLLILCVKFYRAKERYRQGWKANSERMRLEIDRNIALERDYAVYRREHRA